VNDPNKEPNKKAQLAWMHSWVKKKDQLFL